MGRPRRWAAGAGLGSIESPWDTPDTCLLAPSQLVGRRSRRSAPNDGPVPRLRGDFIPMGWCVGRAGRGGCNDNGGSRLGRTRRTGI